MSTSNDLLIEIGTEELPPKALKRLIDAFERGVTEGLKGASLSYGEIKAYAAPRRLALLIAELQGAQADRQVERRGPAVAAAFDDEGNPSKAAQGFARSCSVEVDQLEKQETKKGAWLVHRATETGRATPELIPAIIEEALAKLPIPKRMRWGSLDVEFVRPVHWLVLLFGDEVIDAEILGAKSGRESHGHRFHHPDTLYLGEPAAYAPLLETEGHVIADYATRREAIRAQVMKTAEELGGKAIIDDGLLEEVTALVEWPVAVSGSFEERFLEVPAESLISSMQDHQKYFPVVNEDGQLMPHFITISNIESQDVEQVRAGNERVIRPRLSDAEFFWNQDRKQPLSAHQESLKTVVFQKQLGTLFEKSERVAAVSTYLAGLLGVDSDQARQAALISKCDLMTNMVYEFTDLQGIMGRYYANHDGLPESVANAMDEQYMPRQAGDQLPAGSVGQVLAIADRVDTMLGIFAIGQKPTGTKDPFALRRAALGLLRIIIERGLDIDLHELLKVSAEQLCGKVDKAADAVDETLDYMLERLKAYYGDQGISSDVIEAVLACRPTRPLDFDRRIRAVSAFRNLTEAESLAAANKRIGNILKKSNEQIPESVDAAVLSETAEQALAGELNRLHSDVLPLFESGDYEGALTQLAALREPVDTFFDNVMVNAEDELLRKNRLALLRQINQLFLRVADISLLQG
ncbi:glycine--tRNA ligase subunit beta [Solemya pervernicosa gill symbiont]|uniref:Glycine--tRNA ligase beta subunit n=2 Tax=Gammaproteobacteria incertae sedis TaxID=118884 RepID=A0A1T2L4R0_9GAMM|nr:glycine--tRNA ligase subunit beta [Candidatus Reidiella endopervernicosa]OOZ40095.1 glycine--tRNA ligase subunit beta [Solemya pervernicosa gill symbiont]QKQ25411.1 glycine--tRNA ligase subunit beta [Candidatus Reidiella endopervernicosa]